MYGEAGNTFAEGSTGLNGTASGYKFDGEAPLEGKARPDVPLVAGVLTALDGPPPGL